MTNIIELLSHDEIFTIGSKSNLTDILANVVKVGSDTSNITISIPQNISSSYNLILPVRQAASGESLVYDSNGQLKWHDPTVLKQVVSVYGSTLTGNLISAIGSHDSPTYLDAYSATITPMSQSSKIFVQFKVNYKAALSASNQISFYIKKTYDGNESIYTESLFGPYNAAGGLTGQYISNLIDEPLTTSSISYQLGYKINGNVQISDTLGILGYDTSYNNTIFLQEFEGSGSNATSIWNKGSDSNGLYYNDGTVHIGSNKNSLSSQNTPGLALELSGNLLGTNATFSGNIYAGTFIGDLSGNINTTTITTNNLTLDGTLTTNSTRVEGNLIPSGNVKYDLGSSTHMWRDVYVGPGSLYVNNKKVIEDNNNTINITTDVDQNLTIKTSGAGLLQLNSNVGGIDFNTSNGGTINFNSDIVLQGNISMINTGTAIPINLNDDVDVAGNLDVNSNLKVNDISRKNSNYGVNIESVSINGSEITGQLTGNVTGNVTGHVTGTVSSFANHTTTDLSEGSNLYYTTARVRSNLSSGTGINYDQSTGVFSIGQSVGITDNVQFNNVTVDGILNSDDITGTNITVSNDLVVSGNLTVNGSQTIVNSTTLDIGDNKIVVNADGGAITDAGIIANVSGVEHEFVYKSSNNAWGTTGDLNIGGNVTGNLVGAMTMTGHIIPLTGNTYDIGSPDKQIKDIYVSNNTIFLGEVITLSVDVTKSQLKIKKRNTDVIPKAIRNANPSITAEVILTETFGAGHGKQLSDLKLSHWRLYARNNLTINGKSGNNIEIADILTNDKENWEEDISVADINNILTQIQENMNISGNLTVGSNVTIGGQLTIDTINENTTNNGVVIEGVTINNGNITATTFIGDGSGLTGISSGGNLTNYSDASFNNVDISGNVTATAFIGDGSGLTGISSGGNLTNYSDASFNNVDISGTVTATAFNGNLTGNVSGTSATFSGTVTAIINDINLHNTEPSSINSTTIINILSNNFNDFNKPWYLDNSYNYTTGPAHGLSGTSLNSSLFQGAVLASNGKIILAPLNSAYIGIYDPITNSYNNGPQHGQPLGAFRGGVLAPNGKIILVPGMSLYVGIYDPNKNTYVNGPAHGEGNGDYAFSSGVLAPNGNIIFIPTHSDYIGIYDPITNTYIKGPAHGAGITPFSGGVLAPNGNIILVPFSSPSIGIYNPIANTYVDGAAHEEVDGSFSGGVLAPNGNIILVSVNSAFIGIYNPITNTYIKGPAHGYGEGNALFSGGVLAPNGKIIFVPFLSTKIGIYDPTTNSYYDGPQPGVSGFYPFGGGILAPNGKIILVPKDTTNIGIFENHSYKFTLKNVSDIYTPYFNKF